MLFRQLVEVSLNARVLGLGRSVRLSLACEVRAARAQECRSSGDKRYRDDVVH
jgi:hypothetical protein